MSGEVVDSNPYSRLMALQRMGIVKDYEKIRGKTVGPGGRGASLRAPWRCGLRAMAAALMGSCVQLAFS